MSRTVDLTLPPEKLDELLPKIKQIDGFIGLRIQRNIAVDPKGDVASFELTNDSASDFMLLLEKEGLLSKEDTYLTMSKPVSVIRKRYSKKINGEGSESAWEEVLNSINQQSNMKLNGMGNMLFAGFIAALGISTNTIHLVVGAMVIAPGFEPITRISLGVITSSKDWLEGLKDTVKGYLVLVLGAMIGAYFRLFFDKEILPGSSSYLAEGSLLNYWMNTTPSSIAVSIIAAVSGGIIMMTNRSVLTAGVMIALALIPTAAIMGMAIVQGDFGLAGESFRRFGLEVLIVFFFTGLVFLWKRVHKHKRGMAV